MKKNIILLSIISLFAVNNANAIDISKFIDNLFAKKAGYRAENSSDEKDLSDFQKSECYKHNPWGEIIPYDKSDKQEGSLFFCRAAYSMRYDTKWKTPLWATYILKRENYDHQDWDFLSKIKYLGTVIDPNIPERMQPDLKEYKNSGYVPHQLVPIVDSYFYASGIKDEDLVTINQIRVNEGYFITNSIPVASGLNNALTQFESQTNKLLKKENLEYETILIATGGIYMNGGKGRLGKSGPVIPSHIFKIYANVVNRGTTSYVIPNDNTCINGCNFNNFIVPFKEIERLTGYDVFSAAAPEHAAKIKLDPSEFNRKPK